MAVSLSIDTDYLLQTLQRLLAVPSPAGHSAAGIEECRRILSEIEEVPWQFQTTPKGALTATWNGLKSDAPRALTAHVDTLGALVKSIKANGRLQLFQIGSFDWTAIENESVTIERGDGSTLRGTVLFCDEAYHTHGSNDRPEDTPRNARNMEVRLDAKTDSEKTTRALGVEVGDFIHFDPRPQIEKGFVRSRFLDDKACLACVFAALQAVARSGSTPARRTAIHISNYEEVCHGGANGLPADLHELIAVDVAPVSCRQNSNEFSCSLCVADDDGPYSYDLNRKLKNLAKENEIALRPDIYQQYASDAKAYWKAGGGARTACIGPGTDATHGYERTHLDALVATARLLAAYLLAE